MGRPACWFHLAIRRRWPSHWPACSPTPNAVMSWPPPAESVSRSASRQDCLPLGLPLPTLTLASTHDVTQRLASFVHSNLARQSPTIVLQKRNGRVNLGARNRQHGRDQDLSRD